MSANALEQHLADLEATGGRIDIAQALADLDPEIIAKRPAALVEYSRSPSTRRDVARIEDLLRAAPPWMWRALLESTVVPLHYRLVYPERAGNLPTTPIKPHPSGQVRP